MFMQRTVCAGGIYGSVSEALTLPLVMLKCLCWWERQTEACVSREDHRHYWL